MGDVFASIQVAGDFRMGEREGDGQQRRQQGPADELTDLPDLLEIEVSLSLGFADLKYHPLLSDCILVYYFKQVGHIRAPNQQGRIRFAVIS